MARRRPGCSASLETCAAVFASISSALTTGCGWEIALTGLPVGSHWASSGVLTGLPAGRRWVDGGHTAGRRWVGGGSTAGRRRVDRRQRWPAWASSPYTPPRIGRAARVSPPIPPSARRHFPSAGGVFSRVTLRRYGSYPPRVVGGALAFVRLQDKRLDWSVVWSILGGVRKARRRSSG